MEHIDRTSSVELQRTLQEVEQPAAKKRLLAAIAIENGVSKNALATWFDVRQATINSWLERVADSTPRRDVTGEEVHQSRRLDDEELVQLMAVLDRPPTEEGYDVPWWTPVYVRKFVSSRFGVTYSVRQCRRLMWAAGIPF